MSEWETFCDVAYYDRWRVRRKNERGFNDGFHVSSGSEARGLVDLLNELERELDEAREALKNAKGDSQPLDEKPKTADGTLDGGLLSPSLYSALAGTFDIEAIEQAFFNHDSDGGEPAPGQWEKLRDEWRSFKKYLAAHPRQEVQPERTGGGIVPDNSDEKTNNITNNTL